ncbi:MAG: TetR/AcrR family transcriptional regulator [Sedimentitalea sp.]
MVGKVQERKEKLRERLIEAAEEQIIDGGFHSVKARAMAQKAGCAVGAIYNVFEDINALIMAVNGRTFRKLGVSVAGAVEAAGPQDPNRQMIIMSHAYLRFAADNTHLWRALFDLEMSVDGPVPAWYFEELAKLFGQIARPLSQLFPAMSRRDLDLMTRALFSSVHGIVLLGLERRISGVPYENIENMIEQVLSQIGD